MPFIKIKYYAICIAILLFLTFSMYFNFSHSESNYNAFRSIIKPMAQQPPQLIVTQKNRIFFLKTHKCASSTVQNILMRFGHEEKLDFLLPYVTNYVGNPKHFNSSMIINQYSTADYKFDMFVHHTRYSQEVKSVMRPGTVYITILREPTSLFQSMYSFYHFDQKYKANLIEFVSNVLDKPYEKHVEKRYSNKLGVNQMSWDLGMIPEDFKNIEMINKYINIIEKDFDFIMIFEYFDASLVLLADLIQWPLERMVYLPINTRNDSYKQILSDNDVQKIKQVNMADDILYKRFLKKFKDKINEYGIEKLKIGIGKLMALNQEIVERCVESITNKGYAKTISYKLKENTNTICKYIAINELNYTSYLRKIQYERLRNYKALDKLMNKN